MRRLRLKERQSYLLMITQPARIWTQNPPNPLFGANHYAVFKRYYRHWIESVSCPSHPKPLPPRSHFFPLSSPPPLPPSSCHLTCFQPAYTENQGHPARQIRHHLQLPADGLHRSKCCLWFYTLQFLPLPLQRLPITLRIKCKLLHNLGPAFLLLSPSLISHQPLHICPFNASNMPNVFLPWEETCFCQVRAQIFL